MNRARVAYLSPTYYPYRVPVFDALNRRIKAGFVVVTLRQQPTVNDQLAQELGAFPKRRISGYYVLNMVKSQVRTPMGMLVTPGLPFTLARLRPSVVISNNFNAWSLTTLMLGFRTIIFWEGTAHTERTAGAKRLRLRRWMAGRAKGFVVNGKLSRQYLEETLGVPPEHIVEGGMCPELPPATAVRRTEHPAPLERPPRFLFVGRLDERKGLTHLLQAAALLRDELGPQRFELIVIGDGPDGEALRAEAEQFGLADTAQFLGQVPSGDVWNHYSEADVFVLPTLQDNWPLVVPEAMSMGLPVLVSSFTGSVPDLLREGENGYSFDPFDHAKLAACMRRYVDEPELVIQHGHQSLKLVAQYTPERVADAFISAIRKLGRTGRDV